MNLWNKQTLHLTHTPTYLSNKLHKKHPDNQLTFPEIKSFIYKIEIDKSFDGWEKSVKTIIKKEGGSPE